MTTAASILTDTKDTENADHASKPIHHHEGARARPGGIAGMR